MAIIHYQAEKLDDVKAYSWTRPFFSFSRGKV